LQTIISQAQRIHDLLSELMQFARPPRPQKRPLDLGGLIREVTVALGDLAAQRQVRLVCPELEHPISLYADPRQLRTALTCLLRNAIEAAPADGWAGVRVQLPAPERLELIVEDSGPGPTPPQREHMFDPFYSGRAAGRGRGLGLPTAWRLAREHGGDVCFDDTSTGPTRFVLTLPREAGWNGAFAGGHAEAG
jgi:signal transduction histidine kinase